MTTTARLSPLDTSFLDVERPTAHMHVGWAAIFSAPEGAGRPPGYEELRDHIASRLHRAPAYRRRLARVPLALHEPVWVDDDAFDLDEHVHRAHAPRIEDVARDVMSTPLHRDRPLWEMWIVEGLADGRVGLVGKAHHCMVDGLAAVQLAALLLDSTAVPPPPDVDDWRPVPPPGRLELAAGGMLDRAREQLHVLSTPVRVARAPARAARTGMAEARRVTRALSDALRPSPDAGVLNRPSSSLRDLVGVRRPLDDLRTVKRRFGVTVNDVLLATCAGALRGFLAERGEPPVALKTMVPVTLRPPAEAAALGNRISFLFVDLPCQEPDPVTRLALVHAATSTRKRAGDADGADDFLRAVGRAPRLVQRAVSQLVSTPRAFNLVVSNIPGPPGTLYLRGCRLDEVYPVVPLADRHALSIGMTTARDDACLGLYADRERLPGVEALAGHLHAALDELLAL